jgi:DNA-binding NtrC family response regulator
MAVLIVDDDPVQRRLLEGMVQKFGYEVVTAEGGDAAAALLTGPDGGGIDCVILDLVMPDLDGLGVLARLRRNAIAAPVIVQTAHGGIDNVVSAMRAGAVDFVVKPVSAERLQVSLRNAFNTSALEGELNRIKHSRSGTLGFNDIIAKSPAMQAVLRMAEKAAASSIPVLIAGESGVGKELIARAIHGSGERRAKPFVAVNCGAMPENLIGRSCSAMKRDPSPARPSAMSANSPKPQGALCSSTRWANYRRPLRSSSFALSRKAK